MSVIENYNHLYCKIFFCSLISLMKDSNSITQCCIGILELKVGVIRLLKKKVQFKNKLNNEKSISQLESSHTSNIFG